MTILPISIITLIIGFLIFILSSFPVDGQEPDQTGSYTPAARVEDVQVAANKFNSAYTSVLDDLILFQKNPDYQRAEVKRQKMVTYAGFLINQFQGFSREMQQKLDELSAQAQQASETTPQ